MNWRYHLHGPRVKSSFIKPSVIGHISGHNLLNRLYIWDLNFLDVFYPRVFQSSNTQDLNINEF